MLIVSKLSKCKDCGNEYTKHFGNLFDLCEDCDIKREILFEYKQQEHMCLRAEKKRQIKEKLIKEGVIKKFEKPDYTPPPSARSKT